MENTNKVAVVTGGSKGIGKAIADSFLLAGYFVAILDNNDVEKEIKEDDRVLFIKTDLVQYRNSRDIVERIIKKLGRIDILINNAGFQHISDIENFPEDKLTDMIDLMVITPFLLSKYSIPSMRENGWGRIVNISSIHGMVASRNKAAYITAKHALIGLTKSTAVEVGQYNITCNAIAPSYVNTELVTNQLKDHAQKHNIDESKVLSEVLMKSSPVQKLIDKQEIAEIVQFLCSDAARSITGSTFTIDNGYTSV